MQTFSVAGRVIDRENNVPVPNVRLAFQRQVGGQSVEFANTAAVSNDKGEFFKEGLIAGKYGVVVFTSNSSGMLGQPLTFDIIDQDVNGITVKLVQGASLSGVVIVEPDNPAALTRFSELLLRAYDAGGGVVRSIGGSTSAVAANGSFSLTGLSGGYANVLLTAKTGALPPKGFTLARVERDGEVYARGIPIKEGEQLTGVRVVLNYGTAILSGTVVVENGTLPSGAFMYVGLIKPGEPIGNMRPTRVDDRGHFIIEGIPAGPYEAQVWLANAPPRLFRPVKREVTVQDGVTTDITITIDLTPPKQP
jgi:hypothetical protein